MALKVFVSGCYDMLHSGHVAFFEEAASYGELYVGIGSDRTIQELKARRTVNTDAERLYMIKALKMVKEAWINSGSGILDFAEEVKRLKPDIFFVNADGHSPAKEKFCREQGIKYVVGERIPHSGLPKRSTTALRSECLIPYRIDLAGGWLDQPFVNQLYAGDVITICIEPDYDFNDRSGMATSSRKKAIELWQIDLPEGNKEVLARTLFCYENPPGTAYISGSQDSLGIVLPGLNRLHYSNDYWPSEIESVTDVSTLEWIERRLWLVPLYPRLSDYDVLENTDVSLTNAKELSIASAECWHALQTKDAILWGKATTDSFEAQVKMFPNMVTDFIRNEIDANKDRALGWKISGAGGGGYLVYVSETPVKNGIQIRIRRE
jgi:cytidyltransferase-like protein